MDRQPDYARDINALLYQRAGVDGLFTDFPDLAVDFLKKPHR